jgi:hypothetical protein
MTVPKWQSLGLPGLVGLCLVALALWTQQRWVPAQQRELDEMGSQARRLRHELMASAPPAASGSSTVGADSVAKAKGLGVDLASASLSTPEQAWAAIWQGLPDASDRTPLQQAVLQSARQAGVEVTAVQYRGEWARWVPPSAKSGQGLWRQRLVMPVEGPYPAVRAWLNTLLLAPSLSLDALDVQRPDVASNKVKAQVSVSLWWRQDGRPQ